LYKGGIIADPIAAAAATEAEKLIHKKKSLPKYIQVFQDADYITKSYSDSVGLIKHQIKRKLMSLIGKGSIEHIRTLIIVLKLYGVWIKLDEFTRLNTYQDGQTGGSNRAEGYITGGMRLGPPQPPSQRNMHFLRHHQLPFVRQFGLQHQPLRLHYY
jgi:hypothetical protein